MQNRDLTEKLQTYFLHLERVEFCKRNKPLSRAILFLSLARLSTKQCCIFAQCGNYRKIYSHTILKKKFVKATFLLKTVAKVFTYFTNCFGEREFLVFPHCVFFMQFQKRKEGMNKLFMFSF